MKFLGRNNQLKTLVNLKNKGSASLFVCKGRRRIGKSRLIQEFGKSFTTFIEFQGLAPVTNQDNQDQLDNFTSQLARQVSLPNVKVTDWANAFELLANAINPEEPTLVLLDEISWMGKHDKNFPGKLKIAWDTILSKYNNLILSLCGSVSSWIEDNILNSTHFVGRISKTITLQELSLNECNLFWEKNENISNIEKLRILSVIGGVPKYLEEINSNQTFVENINQLCFNSEGFLFYEMKRLFNSSFEKEREIYRDILNILSKSNSRLTDIIKKTPIKAGGTATKYISHLEQSGFVRRDYIYKLTGELTKSPRIRLCDNYCRFYLTAIKPREKKIEQNISGLVKFTDMIHWRSILGLQFENLIYSNLNSIVERLELNYSDIISIGPYIQRKNKKNSCGCQIDLLILTKFNTAYLCEIKFQKFLTKDIISEIGNKIKVLKRPKHISIRPVLIYAGELSENIEFSDFFYKKIDVCEILSNRS